MAHHVPITVRSESFEGPLDLLLYLIQSHELDISKVSISQITDQYLAYVLLMQELNFDAASEFLVMAATLLHWKSKSLLPQDNKLDPQGLNGEDGPLSQEELIRQLLEHQRYLEAGQTLGQLPKLGEEVFSRANTKPPVHKIWKEMEITDLAMTYQEILIRARKRTQILKKETVSLADKIREFAKGLKFDEVVELRKFLSFAPSRPEIVVTFLATLELARLRKIKVFQEGTYTPIFLELLEDLTDFDSDMATGFDSLQENLMKDPEPKPETSLEAPQLTTDIPLEILPPTELTGIESETAPSTG